MANERSWRSLAVKRIKEGRKITLYKGLDPDLPFNQCPNYNTFALSPDLKKDGDKEYLISGSEANIMLQSSMIKALYEILGNHIGFNIDFEQWFDDFSYEFKAVRYKDNKLLLFPVTTPVWGKPQENRPTFEFTSDDKTIWENCNYHKIKFWRDRLDKDNYIYLTGSLTEIRNQLIDLMQKNASTTEGNKYSGSSITFCGVPLVTLYFQEKAEDVEEGYRALRTQISFRIMDKSDDPRSPLPRLAVADVKQIATQIKTIFAEPLPHKIHRGKETVSIKDKERGYESYIHVFNRADGVDLYTKICQVQGHSIDLKRVFHKTTLDEVGAYPTIPQQVQVLGKTVKEARTRPVGWVHFVEAKLFVSLLDTPIKLCDSKGFLFSDIDTNI